LIDDNLFEINWSLPKELWSKNDCRLISEGLKDSLSMLDGQEIKMRVQEIYYGNKYVYEINYGGKPFSLYSILRPFDRDILDKVEIIQLAKFLVRGGEKAKICRNIFRQVADASHQKSWQAGELLLATVLEAILRNLYNQPFIPTQNKRQNSFDLKNYLKRFREEYLSPNIQLGRQWKKVTNQIIQVQRHLRDRNAHPDWLLDQGGEYSNQETETTLDDMVILSRFYGTMIKALAGFENLTPTTYKSVIDWKIMSIQRGTRNPEQG